MGKVIVDRAIYTKPLTLLVSSINNIVRHPVILLPFATVAFIQLIVLEVLYFSVRPPLVNFFGPVITWAYGQAYLHYPFNFVILPEMFQQFQVPIYILASGFFIGAGILIVAQINSNRLVQWQDILGAVWPQYVHFLAAAIIISVAYYLAQSAYLACVALLLKIPGDWVAPLKLAIVKGKFVGHILVGVLTTVAFAFLLPAIALEKRTVGAAVVANFKGISQGWWNILVVVLLPSLLYVPIMLLKSNVVRLVDKGFPEAVLAVMVLSCLFIMLIDAVIYTAITTYYLWRREQI